MKKFATPTEVNPVLREQKEMSETTKIVLAIIAAPILVALITMTVRWDWVHVWRWLVR